MSKYFAKYLAVEGEINKGDYFIEKDTLGNENILPCIDSLSLVPHDHLVSRKKVKLFLCSRDIQVGDEVTNILDGLTGKSFREITSSEYGEYFKVIGEISPEATWVKDGDEFDEYQEDVKYYHEGREYKEEEWFNNTKGIETTLIQVKGQCGHFH